MTLGMVLGSCCLEQTWLAAAETLSHRRLRSGATNYRRLAADPFTISLVRLTLIGHLRARCAATHFRRLRAAGPTKTAGIAREKNEKWIDATGSFPKLTHAVAGVSIVGFSPGLRFVSSSSNWGVSGIKTRPFASVSGAQEPPSVACYIDKRPVVAGHQGRRQGPF